MAFVPDDTPVGRLPPWEVAKAVAYKHVIAHMSEHLGTAVLDLLGERADSFIAKHVVLVGGGHPSARAVRAVLSKCKDTEWYPGKTPVNKGGRPSAITTFQKEEIARVAMDLKRKRVAPTPARVRAVLPRRCLNSETGLPVSDHTIHKVFKTMCFDENEDDPWQWLTSPAQDYLPTEALPLRVNMAKHILANIPARSRNNYVAIDPCSSLLPRTTKLMEEQQVAAMGKNKWMSKHSSRKGANLRAPAFATKQAGGNTLQVHWTPVFTRGKIHIYVCDQDAAAEDPNLPVKLNDSANLAKFVRNALPSVLESMQEEYGWSTIPRVVVHDKASYMVNSAGEQLNPVFGGALAEAGFRSWAGPQGTSTKWMCAKWGDVYLHETAIAHIRRLLATRFASMHVCESWAQFRQRMQQVQDHMNSDEFAAEGGNGLPGLCTELHDRCRQVVALKGQRLPK
jgi:hypothetical protein